MTVCTVVASSIISIEGIDNKGCKFAMRFYLKWNGNLEETEQALLRELGTSAKNFSSYVVEQGWKKGSWHYE